MAASLAATSAFSIAAVLITKWMLEEEAVSVVKQFDLLVNYRETVLFVMSYVRENKHLLCCIYDSMGRDEMKRFFYADFIGITKKLFRTPNSGLASMRTYNLRNFWHTFIPRPLQDF